MNSFFFGQKNPCHGTFGTSGAFGALGTGSASAAGWFRCLRLCDSTAAGVNMGAAQSPGEWIIKGGSSFTAVLYCRRGEGTVSKIQNALILDDLRVYLKAADAIAITVAIGLYLSVQFF